MAKLSICHPNELSEQDFENLRGTELMEALVRNRMKITFDDNADEDAAYELIHTWLNENCKSNFYITSLDDYLMLYIEHENELLAFKMFFEQAEMPDYIVKSPPIPIIPTIKNRWSDPNSYHSYKYEIAKSCEDILKDNGISNADIVRQMIDNLRSK